MSYKLISLKVNLKVYFEKTNLKINYLWCSRKKNYGLQIEINLMAFFKT